MFSSFESNPITVSVPIAMKFNTSWRITSCLIALFFLILSSLPVFAATTVIGNTGLVGYWPLEKDWRDIQSGYNLVPVATGGFMPSTYVGGPNTNSYGPTGNPTGNGASNPRLIGISRTQGITMEGWVLIPNNNTAGTLFGFGRNTYWNEPKFSLTVGWGFLWVNTGSMGNGPSIRYARYGDRCWHHVAVVLSPISRTGMPLRVYIDGNEAVPEQVVGTLDQASLLKASLFGKPFRIGEFESTDGLTSGASMRVDEVRLWSRALTQNEITLLSRANGAGLRCEGPLLPKNPILSKRCVFPTQTQTPSMEMGVRVLDQRTLAIVSDPNPWLKKRINTDCGVFLKELEAQRSLVQDWFYQYQYGFAIKETLINYRPALLKAVSSADHFQIKDDGGMMLPNPSQYAVWPQAVREFHFPAVINDGSEIHAYSAEVVYFSYLRLPYDLQNGLTYAVTDRWGHAMSFTYNDSDTLSWAIKTNQLGYLPEAPEKYAYLGAWLGPVLGAMELARFDGQLFEVRRNGDNGLAYSGKIAFRADDRKLEGSGEWVYQMDFSALKTPGSYYIRVPGMGRSRTFTLGNNALGEAFYIHARGMYHQRCGVNLTAPYTAWPRGDNHTSTWYGGFPPDDEDYRDHSAEGWGLRDENGRYPTSYGFFNVIQFTATDTVVPSLKGGWHDAADFDRNPSHLKAVNDLAHAYLMFPENFTDGQLNLPESGNGVPDILDEAAWGMEVWRLAQQTDGRVSTRIEATSHPQIPNPAIDTQRYYLGLATHNSSLTYAQSAALLGRALVKAGDVQRGALFIDSAKRAFNFGIDTGPRVNVSYKTDKGVIHTWTESPTVDSRRVFYALVQLWLATGDPAYRSALDTANMQTLFKDEVGALYWRTNSYDLTDITLAPSLFPVGWADLAKNGLVKNADDWLAKQTQSPYRKLWHAPGQGYFPLMGWGANGFMPIRHLIAAWRMSGEQRFLSGALLAVDWMHGGNPQGRVNTTGLGQYNVTSPLHAPSDTDRITDPVPGITIYAYTGGIPYSARTAVYGLIEPEYAYMQFLGSSIAQLPPPWDDTSMTVDAIGKILYDATPIWRRMVALEGSNVAQSEFTITETIVPAASVTGPLMGKGWLPSTSLISRGPRAEKDFRESLWYLP